ncbi:MAG TPA: PspC domain-containing protein [Anaerolineales bacterium]|nr:PspC domain-containing protein [Anaerolineales bacterium]
MNTSYRQLTRSTTNRMLAGVCAGIGEYTNVDPTVIRLIAVLLIFLTGPGVIIAYLIMALIIPEAPMKQSQ